MDFSRYAPPGVFTETLAGPVIGIQANTPSSVGIFGQARGYQTDVETVVVPTDFTATDLSVSPVNSQTLRQFGIDPTSIVVSNVASGVVYTPQTVTSPPNGDYVIVSITGPSGSAPSFDTTYQIHRVIGSTLAANTAVQISYNYTNANYFQPQRLYSFNDAVNLYGPPFDASGNIISELTLATNFAFINGASTVVTAAVPGSGQSSDYQSALRTFEGVNDIAVVVCASGNSNLFPAVRDHVSLQSSQQNERRAILGTDGSSTAISSSSRIAAAQALQNSRVALVSPSTVQYYNSTISQVQTIGSEFVAAGLAGLAVSLPPAQPLTRKQVLGFLSVDTAPEAQKSLETQGGLLVIDSNNSTSSLKVRHGVTTNPSTLITREWNILGQQDSMAYRLRSYFDADGLIGSIISDITLANVKASAEAALLALVTDGTIADYANLTVSQDPTFYDVIQISYSWKPALPLNYIVVQFALDVTNGTTTSNPTL
jgi:hypothetical protein